MRRTSGKTFRIKKFFYAKTASKNSTGRARHRKFSGRREIGRKQTTTGNKCICEDRTHVRWDRRLYAASRDRPTVSLYFLFVSNTFADTQTGMQTHIKTQAHADTFTMTRKHTHT
jgi:hypothetical protein